MNYEIFKRHLRRAGLTVREFAELVKMNRNSVTNYKKIGQVPGHLAALAVLMSAMADQNVEFRQLLIELDTQPKRPRGNNGRELLSARESRARALKRKSGE